MRQRPAVLATALATLGLTIAASPAQGTYPGANGRIAFERFDPTSGDDAYYTANPDGSSQLRVTDQPAYCSEWSPDGRRLALTLVQPDGNTTIATMAPDGSAVEILGPGECPSWSPDGSRIVFDFSPQADPNAPGFATHLYVMGAHGADRQPLMSPSVDGFDVEPRWQPTGHLITFARIRKVTLGIQQEAVYVVRPDGSGLRRLTSLGLAAEHPTWSPDGRSITFNDASFKPGVHETIWLMRSDGTNARVIYQGTANSGGTKPQFSPDGNRILFMCVKYGSAFGRGAEEDICTMNADGTNVVDITNTPDLFEQWPAWGSAPLP